MSVTYRSWEHEERSKPSLIDNIGFLYFQRIECNILKSICEQYFDLILILEN